MNHPDGLPQLVRAVHRQLQERRVHIAVVGDMILDNTIVGEEGGSHFEMKVPILGNAFGQESIGGAANIALALARLGIEVSLFGIIGSDLPGRQLENMLDRQPFAKYLITERGWPTPRKDWIYRRDGQRAKLVQRIDYDRPLSSQAREELVGEFRARWSAEAQVVVVTDHNLGSIGPESLALIDLAKERQAKIVGIPRSTVLRGQPLDAIVLNAREMCRLAAVAEDADARALAVAYARDHTQHVFLTMFEEGVLVCRAGLPANTGTLIAGYPLENPQWVGVRDMTTVVVALGLALGLEAEAIGTLSTVFRHLVAAQRDNGRVLWRNVFQFVGLES